MLKTKSIPVIVFKNKSKENRYLAASMDVGDWSDPDLDVKLEDIESGYLIWKKDLTPPPMDSVEIARKEAAEHKRYMQEKFGENAFIHLDFEEVLKHYEPVNIDMPLEKFNLALEITDW